MHVIKLDGYNATVENGEKLELGTFDSYGEEQLQIVKAPDWENLSVIATFNPPYKKPVQAVVDSVTGVIKVPKEATADSYGVGTIVFVGLADGVQRISSDVEYIVRRHSNASGTEPAEPTPSVVEQILTEARNANVNSTNAKKLATDAKDIAQSVRDDADNGKFNGTKGDTGAAGKDGLTPHIGENGNWWIGDTDTGISAKGAKGDTGAKGEKGDTGAQGPVGETGPVGPKGDTGPQGERGEKGPQGEVGPEGPAGKDGVQIDDSAIGDKPWSSKHIIDMLCPPLEEIGNPVVCYPVAGYPLGVKAKWEPVQEGSGTPSPENIRPIKGRDSVKVERCGENLLPHIFDRIPDTVTKDGLTIVKTPKGTIHVSGKKTGTNWTDLFRVSLAKSELVEIPAGTYSWGSNVSLTTIHGNIHTSPFTTDMPRIITGAYAAVNTAGTYNNDYIPALVAGSEKPTKVEPYQGESNTLTLSETVYGGEVDAVTGEGRKTWGTETISRIASIGELTSVVRCTATLLQKSVTAKSGSAISNWLGEDVSYVRDKESFYTNQMQIYIKISKTRLSSFDFAGVNAYLSEHPLTVCYKLAEPVPFTATGAHPIPALAGVNTVLTDADSATVTGRADPIKRITDLEDAVASQT